MQHVPELLGVINPVRAQCYGDESLMGATVAVWRRSMSGRYKNKIQRVVLTKRLTGLLLRLEESV